MTDAEQSNEPARAQGRALRDEVPRSRHGQWTPAPDLAGYLGKSDRFDRAIGDFSVAYADQNERDFDAFTTAIAQGRLPAQE